MRILTASLAIGAFLLVSSCLQLLAQESPCDVPLVVTRFEPKSRTVELVKDLTARDLTVSVQGSPYMVKTASVDTGSKRVALILDGSKKVPDDQWKLETQTAISLLENARPLDRFVLFLVGVDTPVVPLRPFGDVQAQLTEMANSRPPAADASERIYDVLLAAARLFDPPQFGDAIFLFGHSDDFGSHATPEQAEELILKNRMRFYGLSFTNPLEGKVPAGFDPNQPLPEGVRPDHADMISHETGYFFSFQSVDVLKMRGQLALLEASLRDSYAGIAEPYRLSITLNASDKAALDLAVVRGKERGIFPDDLHYPHVIYPCTPR